MKIKGKTTFELTDVNTGKVEKIEDLFENIDTAKNPNPQILLKSRDLWNVYK